MGKSIMELYRLRESLFNKLTGSHLDWQTVTLAEGVTLKICKVVKVDGFYLPVTAQETFDFCRPRGYFPLTRAVIDQIQNKVVFVQTVSQPELPDFEKYSKYLNEKKYDGIFNGGAHKLWLLSKVRGKARSGKPTKAVNYGCYELITKPATGTNKRGGARLNSNYNPINGMWGGHNDIYWDYSQLLQVMYAPEPLTIDGERMSLAMALRAGKSVVSDEGEYSQDDLP